MSTDDTGSWARPNPTDRTDPDFVDITRLAPAAPSDDGSKAVEPEMEPESETPEQPEGDHNTADVDAPSGSNDIASPSVETSDLDIDDAELQPVDVDDVDTDQVADEDIAEIMAGFEQRASSDETPAATETDSTGDAAETQSASPAADDSPDQNEAGSPSEGTSDRNDDPSVNESDKDSDAAAETAPTGFAALGLRPELLETLNDLGYEEPTPIQRETIPILLTGSDLLGCHRSCTSQ